MHHKKQQAQKELAVRLSLNTFTPIPFYLGLTLDELMDYAEAVKEVLEKK